MRWLFIVHLDGIAAVEWAMAPLRRSTASPCQPHPACGCLCRSIGAGSSTLTRSLLANLLPSAGGQQSELPEGLVAAAASAAAAGVGPPEGEKLADGHVRLRPFPHLLAAAGCSALLPAVCLLTCRAGCGEAL